MAKTNAKEIDLKRNVKFLMTVSIYGSFSKLFDSINCKDPSRNQELWLWYPDQPFIFLTKFADPNHFIELSYEHQLFERIDFWIYKQLTFN